MDIEKKFKEYKELMDKSIDAMIKAYQEQLKLKCDANCKSKNEVINYYKYKLEEITNANNKLACKNQELANEVDRFKRKIKKFIEE